RLDRNHEDTPRARRLDQGDQPRPRQLETAKPRSRRAPPGAPRSPTAAMSAFVGNAAPCCDRLAGVLRQRARRRRRPDRCRCRPERSDADVARALIDGGANIEAAGASIAGGSPLNDAVGYGCWQVTRLLVAATHRRVLAGMPRRP